MSAQAFNTVWFNPYEKKRHDMNLLAYRDVGHLTINESSIEFKSASRSVVISKIRNVSYGRQGRDFMNKWVKVEYEEGGVLATASFADGNMLGWSGIFGGTRRIFEAINRVPKVVPAG